MEPSPSKNRKSDRLTPKRIAELDARSRELAAQLANLQAQIQQALSPPAIPGRQKPKKSDTK